ncbi:MAG: hypothetical protein RL110_1663, partial [Bacteroidota bacterium]
GWYREVDRSEKQRGGLFLCIERGGITKLPTETLIS